MQVKIYKPVTILTENALGQLGTEDWPQLTMGMIIGRCKELSEDGWEPVEIQVDESQDTLPVDWNV